MKKHMTRLITLTLAAALAVSPIMIHAEELKTASLYTEDAESDELIFPEEDETVDDTDAMDIEVSEADDAGTDEEIVDDTADVPDTEDRPVRMRQKKPELFETIN